MRLSGILLSLIVAFMLPGLSCSDDDGPADPVAKAVDPVCDITSHSRHDAHTPTTQVDDWSDPVRLGEPVNTPCPQDAIEIDVETGYLYVMYTEDILEGLTADKILARENNTYRLEIIELPDQFGEPEYFDLQLGTAQSLDGELSFDHQNNRVFFHSNRATNLGYIHAPYADDFLDIYIATLSNGTPTSVSHPPPPLNSVHPDGEHAIHPNGIDLYFASLRPEGLGSADIWMSTQSEGGWSEPENPGAPINSYREDKQPAFTADGDTMYFVSDRNVLLGTAIYRSAWNGDSWSSPDLVISGIAGEPSLTPDGRYLYFVHVLTDTRGVFDADVWYCERK